MIDIHINDVSVKLHKRSKLKKYNYEVVLSDIEPLDSEEEFNIQLTLAQLKSLGQSIVAFCQAEEKNAGI